MCTALNTKPSVLDESQITKCQICKHASGKKMWCCKWGFYFKQPEKKVYETAVSKIIVPAEKPQSKAKPTLSQMAGDFIKAMFRWGKSGLACVSKDEYVRRRSICSECTDGWRCPHCGCMLWAKVALATEKCPEEKW